MSDDSINSVSDVKKEWEGRPVRTACTTSCGLTHRFTCLSSNHMKHISPLVEIESNTRMPALQPSFALLISVLSTGER